MPLVSDPGYVLVQGCVAAGLAVEVLPGPSAALAALVASRAARRRVAVRRASCRASAAALAAVLGSPETVVAFESPRRVAASLAVLAELDAARPVAVCRELTKVHEEVVRGTAAELAERYASEAPRGEVVLVIGGAPPRPGPDPAAVDAVRRLVEAGAKARVAARVVAELTGAPANALYKEVAESSAAVSSSLRVLRTDSARRSGAFAARGRTVQSCCSLPLSSSSHRSAASPHGGSTSARTRSPAATTAGLTSLPRRGRRLARRAVAGSSSPAGGLERRRGHRAVPPLAGDGHVARHDWRSPRRDGPPPRGARHAR